MAIPSAPSPALGTSWTDADGMHLDVRGLAPPQPFVAILRLLHQLDGAGAVIVHLDRDPHPLYPELAELGWQAQRVDGAGGGDGVCLRLSPVL